LQYIGGLQCSYLLYDIASEAVVAAGAKHKLSHLTYDLKSGEPVPHGSIEFP
jgi:hypothetical protein